MAHYAGRSSRAPFKSVFFLLGAEKKNTYTPLASLLFLCAAGLSMLLCSLLPLEPVEMKRALECSEGISFNL